MKKLMFLLFCLPTFVLGQKYTDVEISEQPLDIVSWNLRYFPFSSKTPTYVSNIIINNGFEIIAFQEIKNKKNLKNYYHFYQIIVVIEQIQMKLLIQIT